MNVSTYNGVGDISNIEIGHDNTGVSAGWFLSHVIVCVKDGSSRKWSFNCKQW